MFKVGTTNLSTREKWIRSTLQKIPNGSRILDAGAGESPYKSFCGHLEYISQDFGQYDGKGDVGIQTGHWDNSKLDIVSDVTKIPLPDGSVDAIMCTEVFEHIPDPVLAIREFDRLIKPGGHLLITAPFCSLTHFAPYHFYSGFNRYFYEKHLPQNHFDILDLQVNGNFFEFLGQELHRVPAVASRYSNTKIGLVDKFFLKGSLWLLQRLSGKDKNSSELLNYGMQVFAKKRN